MLGSARLQTIVCCARLDVCRGFYADTLGLALRREAFNGLYFDLGGADLLLAPVPEFVPWNHTMFGLAVADIAGEVARLAERGAVRRDLGFPHDDQGIVTTPDRSRVAWFFDPDGTTFSIVQYPGQVVQPAETVAAPLQRS